MAMTTEIDEGIGIAPGTWAAVTGVTWSLDDLANGTTQIPTPTSAGTNFSYIKSFQITIVATGGLSMTNVLVGKVSAETTTGTKLWSLTSHAAYTQAAAAPASTVDNNVTAPTMNGSAGAAMPLLSAAVVYAAGPYNTTGRKGNIVEVCLGVDATNITAGTTVATPTLRWSWTEG